MEDATSTLLPVLVITAAHSRFMCGRMIPTRTTEDLLLGTWELLQQLGRVPRRLIWDNEAGIGRGRRRAHGVAEFAGTLATKVVLLKPRDPESKGVVERRNGFFETSFMPGRVFASPADFNGQFADWLTGANHRIVRTPKARPVDLVEADRAADLDQVRVTASGRLVADHDHRWARGLTITDPAHLATAARLRHDYQHPRPRVTAEECLARDLADYDRAFGLDQAGLR